MSAVTHRECELYHRQEHLQLATGRSRHPSRLDHHATRDKLDAPT